MLTSYHVHSIFSDGSDTIHELVRAASETNLKEIGISDHYVCASGSEPIEWSMPLDALPRYFDEIRAAAGKVAGRIAVRFGLEADYDPVTVADLREILAAYPFDYVIGSIHFVDGFPIDESPAPWRALTERERNDVIRCYWARVAEMAQSGLFDFAGHLDLYKKFGYLPTEDISAEISSALDALAKSGMAAEFNTSGWFKPDICEAYPSPGIVKGCFERRIPMLITADAHSAAHLTRSYERAARDLSGAGYDSLVLFEKRRMRPVPLDYPGV